MDIINFEQLIIYICPFFLISNLRVGSLLFNATIPNVQTYKHTLHLIAQDNTCHGHHQLPLLPLHGGDLASVS
jgi:hypothetical protein